MRARLESTSSRLIPSKVCRISSTSWECCCFRRVMSASSLFFRVSKANSFSFVNLSSESENSPMRCYRRIVGKFVWIRMYLHITVISGCNEYWLDQWKNFGTVAQFVQQLLYKWNRYNKQWRKSQILIACYLKIYNSAPILIAHQIVVDRHKKLLFRIVVSFWPLERRCSRLSFSLICLYCVQDL